MTTDINLTVATEAIHSFEIKDKAGRVMGMTVKTWECDFAETTESFGYTNILPGHYFSCDLTVTRDGNRFGASRWPSHFATAAERDAYITKRLAAALKSAQQAAK